MAITWNRDFDTKLEQAKKTNKPILLDFSAAPMWSGCAQLDAEVWPDRRVEQLVTDEFIPVRVHVRDHADEFKRLGDKYGVEWTPTILMFDPSGNERHRIEGFLPLPEFVPQLEFGLARINFSLGNYEDSERRLRGIVSDYPESDIAPEALYWAGVSQYKATNDSGALQETATALRDKYRDTAWAKKGSVWSQKS
jgi:thioredoxin-related protein